MSTPDVLHDSLRDTFGFDAFLPGQHEAMTHLMNGRSTAVVFPTGGGKSLCYQLPALHLDGLTLVVSPLIALMKDQIDALRARGVDASRLDSSLSADEYRNVIRRVRDGELRILYVSPERFNNERFRALIAETHVSLFAVDEAHCISEWGHNFRPVYLKLARFARAFEAERCLALTATATPKVLDDICDAFDIAPECAIRTPFYRPNLTLRLQAVDERTRMDALHAALEAQREEHGAAGPCIVYVTHQKTAERVAARLAEAGYDAMAYHAGLDNELRSERQDRFMASDEGVVVATIAFGMGIDKSDIRAIVHYNMPKSLENYAQEIGRAGRDGEPANCTMLLCPDDLNALENFVYGDTPDLEAIQRLMCDLLGHGPELTLSPYHVSREHDIRKLVLRTILTWLELEGIIEGGTPIYTTYRFKPHVPSKEILERFPERRPFLSALLSCAKKRKTWFDIDLQAAARKTTSNRARVVRALDFLSEHGLMEVKARDLRLRYKVLKRPDPDALARDLHARALRHEARDIERLHQVVGLYEHPGCKVSKLGAYFGEPLDEDCGHCSWCLGEQTETALPERTAPPLDEELWSAAQALADEKELLQRPRALSRFLCGISSPQIGRERLRGHALFGAMRDVPFVRVLECAQG